MGGLWPAWRGWPGWSFSGSAIGIGVIVFAGWVVLLASLLLTARAEEPLLLDRYGTRYRDYAESVGRFVPGIGRLRR